MWELFKIQLVGIVLSIFCTVYWSKLYPKHLFLSRKILHILVISLSGNIIFLLPDEYLKIVITIISISSFILFFLVQKGFFKSDQRKSWGIFYFPIGLLFLLLVFPNERELIGISFYILAFSDGFSAIFGRFSPLWIPYKFQKINHINWSPDSKTIIGSMVFALSTALILWLFLSADTASNFKNLVVVIWFIALILTGVELSASKGSDNLFVPIFGFLFLHNIENIFLMFNVYLIYYIPLLLIGIIFIKKFNWLSNSGIFQAILLLTSMVMAKFTLMPIFLFFILGSISSKLNKGQVSDRKHGKARDGYQVLANGGIVLLLSWLKIETGLEVFNVLMFISVSVSIADTFSSEFGMKFGGQPFDILKFKRVGAGLSGGVSFIGTIASIFGAGMISIYYYFMYDNLEISLLILIAGISGSLLDSVVGSLLQPKYKSANGEILDFGKISEKISGISFFSNDFVNFLSNILVTAIFYVILVYLM
jgi:uncharacterized protein (TIGR00297 family)